jgi:hypothetical protein
VPKFRFYITQSMSKAVDIDAASLEDAFKDVEGELYFNVNISNDFDEDGEVQVLSVDNEDTGERVWDEAEDAWPE